MTKKKPNKLKRETCPSCARSWEGRFDDRGRCCIYCGHEWVKPARS